MHRTRVALARLAAGAVAVTGATAGLAYAGVDLPGQAAEQAFEAVLNVELPNQGAPEEAASTDARSAEAGAVAERVRAVIEAWTGERGCEFGQAVAAAARGDAEGGPAEDPCTKSDAAAEGSKATGAEKSAAGKARAEDARAAAAEKAAAAEIRAAEKAAAGTATGAEKSGSGQTTAEEKSSTGKATAEEKSSAGKATGEEKSSGAGENSQKP